MPYHPERSELFKLLNKENDDERMPPFPNDRLPDSEIETIRQWILEGALPFPKGQ